MPLPPRLLVTTALCAAVLAVLAVLPLPAATGVPEYGSCLGRTPTIVGDQGTVRGTSGNDVIVGGPGTAVLAGPGKDIICTYGGNVDAGDGDDLVVVQASGQQQSGDLQLGKGEDSVLTQGTASVQLDLRRMVLWTDAGRFSLHEVERYFAASEDMVRVRGGEDRDRVWATGCRLVLHGGGGDDSLAASKGSGCGDTSSRTVARLYGDAGDDDLRGTTASDELFGGQGHDRANGVRGDDLCRAEVQRRCDR